jgi:hypothetical protein
MTLYSGKRKSPFTSGYRPAFKFDFMPWRISGKIDLINGESFPPGNTDIVKVTFLDEQIIVEKLKVGTKFTFDEVIGGALGEGEILNIEIM